MARRRRNPSGAAMKKPASPIARACAANDGGAPPSVPPFCASAAERRPRCEVTAAQGGKARTPRAYLAHQPVAEHARRDRTAAWRRRDGGEHAGGRRREAGVGREEVRQPKHPVPRHLHQRTPPRATRAVSETRHPRAAVRAAAAQRRRGRSARARLRLDLIFVFRVGREVPQRAAAAASIRLSRVHSRETRPGRVSPVTGG